MKVCKIIPVYFTVILFCSCIKERPGQLLHPGVPKQLADHRVEVLSDIHYKLHFRIPDSKESPIAGDLILTFNLTSLRNGLILDFNENPELIQVIHSNSESVDFSFNNEHIIIPPGHLKNGKNEIHIQFIAGESSLNRTDDFLYTLFVPDRARTAFPCFGQPNLKDTYTLSLTIPADWIAVANGKMTSRQMMDTAIHYTFTETEPLPSYLFAFVAGDFSIITREKAGRKISLYHRETDAKKVVRNTNVIFDLVFHTLEWMESYTGIPYPFSKYDMIAIPSFQYGGMEHTGATLYRSDRIFLDQSATKNQKLGRASLVAHETAHMWFGGLVTMHWFDEVWLKEVFASFIADKIVSPNFPEVNHNLKFLLLHYPSAYSIDRTPGTHPIIQPLDNLMNAGTLYGDIIYHKAPVVMRHLEKITGEQPLQMALREYLTTYAYGNAGWNELIAIIENRTQKDLQDWSHTWVYEPGMPVYNTSIEKDARKILSIQIDQSDPFQQGRIWEQELQVLVAHVKNYSLFPFFISGNRHSLEQAIGLPVPDFILLNGKGMGYGYFQLDTITLEYLLQNINLIEESLIRGNCWVSLRDAFFESLKDPRNREREPWVITSLHYLHHPLRSECSEKYILSSLEMLEEIQKTGDIFFPKNWLDATFSGYSSEEAANIVRKFLEEHPDYPEPLKLKILQSADLLFRVIRIREEGRG